MDQKSVTVSVYISWKCGISPWSYFLRNGFKGLFLCEAKMVLLKVRLCNVIIVLRMFE